MLRGSLHLHGIFMACRQICIFSSMPRQKIVDALTGVISNQAVLPNRFCVSWPLSRNRWIGLFSSGTVDGRYLPCWDSCEKSYGTFGDVGSLSHCFHGFIHPSRGLFGISSINSINTCWNEVKLLSVCSNTLAPPFKAKKKQLQLICNC